MRPISETDVLLGSARGLRRATRARNGADAAEERIGFSIIVKPIAGAGSADTYAARDEGLHAHGS